METLERIAHAAKDPEEVHPFGLWGNRLHGWKECSLWKIILPNKPFSAILSVH
jgi:hypothetical protein